MYLMDRESFHSRTSPYTRCGWSVDDAGIGLGEAHNSYGYGGTGKAVVNNQYNEYGETYGPGDVIGCFVVSTAFH